MRLPFFNFEQYVDQNLMNSAMTSLLSSMIEMGSNDVFFLPGLVNPASIVYAFNNNLIPTITLTNTGTTAFKCLFQTGNYCSGHGVTNGIDSPTYSVDFTSFVPASGTVTVYCIAQYLQTNQSTTTIIGPPVGHPDFTPNFTPNTGYTLLQDTLKVSVTTTVPDNQNSIELFRVTLTSGQTSITSVNTNFQVLARVNASLVQLAGDVTGSSNANVISAWQGHPISLATPAVNSVPLFNGSNWGPVNLPTTLPPSGPAGGDLVGNYPNPQVAQSTTSIFTANSVSANNIYSGFQASTANACVILGQSLFGVNQNGFITLTSWTGSIRQDIYIQWGYFTNGGAGVTGDTAYTVNWNVHFPNAVLWAVADMVYYSSSTPDLGVGMQTNGPSSFTPNFNVSSGVFFVNRFNLNGPAPGFMWLAVGY